MVDIGKNKADNKRDGIIGIEDSTVKIEAQKPIRYVPLGAGIWIREDAVRKKMLGAAA